MKSKTYTHPVTGVVLTIVWCKDRKRYMHPICAKGARRRMTDSAVVANEWARELFNSNRIDWGVWRYEN